MGLSIRNYSAVAAEFCEFNNVVQQADGVSETTKADYSKVADTFYGLYHTAANNRTDTHLQAHQDWQKTNAPAYLDAMKEAKNLLARTQVETGSLVANAKGPELGRVRNTKLQSSISRLITEEDTPKREVGGYWQGKTPLISPPAPSCSVYAAP